MAERRYGFRFSFAEGCIIVVSILGASFLVFLFGVYAGRELESRKAAEHTSLVRLTASPEGETVGAGKGGQEKSAPAPSAVPLTDKTTVVIMPPPRPGDAPNTAPGSGSPVPQEKTLAAGSGAEQKPQSAVANGQPTKTTPIVSPSFPQGVHPSSPEKSLTAVQGKESNANLALSQKTRATPPNVATSHTAEETKQTVQVMQAVKKEQASLPAKQPGATPGRWSVQVQAMRDEEGARRLVKALQSEGFSPTISKVVRDGEIWYRVRVGSFMSPDEARASVEQLRRTGKFSQAYPVSN